MPFTGKATFSAGASLPELAEDVSDIVSIVSPHETPLLDHLGDPAGHVSSTVHEWLEDGLLPNTGTVNDALLDGDTNSTQITVADGSRFQVGDQIQRDASREVMLVTAIAGDGLTVVRGYGGSTPAGISDGQTLNILGGAALEGADAPTPRFTSRVRKSNYTQIFTASVEVSGSHLAARQLGIDDELDYQKQERLRELLRDLENCVTNGVAASASPQGSDTVRRTMRGIVPSLVTNRIDGQGAQLSETLLNQAMRQVWEAAATDLDTIVVGGYQKRRLNGFMSSARMFSANDTRYRDAVSVYESDFGACRVVLSRWLPADVVLLLDSSRVNVLPLLGRSFQFKRLATTGDRETGQLIGEYTLELRSEAAHGMIHGLATSA